MDAQLPRKLVAEADYDPLVADVERRQGEQPSHLNGAERQSLLALGGDLQPVWTTPTTTDRDRKELPAPY